MKKRNQVLVFSMVIAAIITVMLFINKSRLDASSERISTKPPSVSVTPVIRKVMPFQLSSVGILQAYRDVPVIAETQGKVLRKYAEVGDYINAGDPIVKVDTILKYAAFVAAKTASVKAENDLARSVVLHREGNLSNNELELATLNFRSAEAQYLVAKRQYEDANICAPISGEIAECLLDIGMMASPGSPVATIVDVSKVKASIAVSEHKISRIKKGMAVTVTADAHPGITFSGTVRHIGPKAGESLLFPVEISIPNNRQHPLKAGMTATVRFQTSGESTALMIPRTALLGSTREGSVYAIMNSIAHLRPVIVGSELDSEVEILSGLQEGDLVVTVGSNTIRDGSSVSLVNVTSQKTDND